jgi:hypothetical protein
MVFVHLQGTTAQALFTVLVRNYTLVVLNGVRNIRVVGILALLHLRQEFTVVCLRSSWL